MTAIFVTAAISVIVLGAYALSWRVLSWEREDDRRLEGLQCPALYTGRYANIGLSTLRCELEDGHHGPHTAKLEGYTREHWT